MKHATVIDLLEEAERCPSWIEGINRMADERRARGESRYSFPIQRRTPGPGAGTWKRPLDYSSAGRKTFLVEELPDQGKEEG